MKLKGLVLMSAAALSLMVLGGCEKKESPAPGGTTTTPATAPKPGPGAAQSAPAPAPDSKPALDAASKGKTYRIGVIAKSNDNAVFQAARTGATAAAAELSKKYNCTVEAIWKTPDKENAQVQAQYVEQLVSQGVDGLAISCTDAGVLKKVIDDAVAKGVTVVTFDSDSADSKRMAYYGVNDETAGKIIMQQLAKAMGDKGGPIAILGGNQSAPNLQARIRGVRAEIKALEAKGFSEEKVHYHTETPQDAVNAIQQAQNANPKIAGWAMVGGWPLFTANALDGIADKGVAVVSMDTLTQQLIYVENGQCAALVGQDCYGWGHESVRIICEKLIENKTPASPVVYSEPTIVTKQNVAEVKGQWEKWLGTK
ncbi:MAG: substrate-binding domain-containing protein [Phycisphaerales bacterium]